MRRWETPAGFGAEHFDTSLGCVTERVRTFFKSNGAPVEHAEKVVETLTAPGAPFEIVEEYISQGEGTTGAFHLKGPDGKGQKYRTFKNAPHTLREVYLYSVENYASKEFIVYKGPDAEGREERYTFGEAFHTAGALASYLVDEFGVQHGDRIAQLSRNNAEWVISFMAATVMDCVAVPMNSMWVPAELEYGINDSGSIVVFADTVRAEAVLPLCRQGKVPKLRALVVAKDPSRSVGGDSGSTRLLTWHEILSASQYRSIPSRLASPEDNAKIMYTSGTTGFPKGVCSTHRAVVSALRSALFFPFCLHASAQMQKAATGGASSSTRTEEQHSVLCPVPLFHATGSHAIMLMSYVIGRKVVLMHKWDPLEALKLIQSERVTSFTGVPTMSMELLHHPDYDKYDTSTLKGVGGGGAPPPARLSSDTEKKGQGAFQGWGLTETNALSVATSSHAEYVRNPSSCGRPHVLVDLKVVDDKGKELPPGSVGEILLRSVSLMKEYWNKPEATAESISVDGWFRSGDIGRLDADGALYILDRAKDLIIRGGENISCAEVETAIYEHPSVQECSVFGLPDERLGEIVAAAVVKKVGANEVSGPELETFCLQRLAKFKVPARMFLWREGEQLPRGATGKIPKRAIKDDIKAGRAPCTQILPVPSKL